MESEIAYEARVAECLAALGISTSYGRERRMRLQPEAADLVSVGSDIHGRERHLTPRAAAQWEGLKAAATREEITLWLVSAYRSLDYQRRIFERKIAAGATLVEILSVNAPRSEEHTSELQSLR